MARITKKSANLNDFMDMSPRLQSTTMKSKTWSYENFVFPKIELIFWLFIEEGRLYINDMCCYE